MSEKPKCEGIVRGTWSMPGPCRENGAHKVAGKYWCSLHVLDATEKHVQKCERAVVTAAELLADVLEETNSRMLINPADLAMNIKAKQLGLRDNVAEHRNARETLAALEGGAE